MVVTGLVSDMSSKLHIPEIPRSLQLGVLKKNISIFAIILSFLFLYTSLYASEKNMQQDSGVDHKTLSTCVSDKCHRKSYGEWFESMHSRSNAEKSRLVKAFYTALTDQKKDVSSCDSCHDPVRHLHKDRDLNTDLNANGVECIVCHSISGVNKEKKIGIDHYTIDFQRAHIPPEQTEGGIHHTESSSTVSVNTCTGCHATEEDDLTLGLIESREDLNSCKSCHLKDDTIYQHLFTGSHSEKLLKEATIISGNADKKGERTILNVNIENFTEHPLPFGFPLRSINVKISGLDSTGKEVWNNYQDDPFLEDPVSSFGKIFKEEDILFAHYSPTAKVSPERINILLPDTIKELTYEIPSNAIDFFLVQLKYRLLQESVVKKLNIDSGEGPDVVMAEVLIFVNLETLIQ